MEGLWQMLQPKEILMWDKQHGHISSFYSQECSLPMETHCPHQFRLWHLSQRVSLSCAIPAVSQAGGNGQLSCCKTPMPALVGTSPSSHRWSRWIEIEHRKETVAATSKSLLWPQEWSGWYHKPWYGSCCLLQSMGGTFLTPRHRLLVGIAAIRKIWLEKQRKREPTWVGYFTRNG